jgi:sec-independent protein translocase protein TatC
MCLSRFSVWGDMARKPRDRKEATFLEHLEELRRRLIRCFIYVAVGTALSWTSKGTLMEVAQAPLQQAGRMAGVGAVEMKIFQVAGGFTLSMSIAAVAGIILAAPLWLMELWLFIEPALEDHERKWVVPLLPAAVVLFLSGVSFCYWLSPRAFAILLKFQADLGAKPELMLDSYLVFFLRLLLVFGAMFEMPLVIMFLAAIGVVKSAWLLKQWRIAVVLIAIAAAVLTPTPDAVTMSFLGGPLIGLYFLSILLARIVEKRRGRSEPEEPTEFVSAPADPYATYTSDDVSPEPPEEVEAIEPVEADETEPTEVPAPAAGTGAFPQPRPSEADPAADDSADRGAPEPEP